MNWTKTLFLALGLSLSLNLSAKIIVAIDAGHGGKDPGAIGKNLGVKEKDVTLAIARELKGYLDADPNFSAVMTRNSDEFVQLPERTEIARKKRANFLVSIHADSSPGQDLRGASVWVLSNRRAGDELGKWLEDSEKQSELLGGAGSVLANHKERYLNQTVLDLQFSHAQRTGYELGKYVLKSLGNVGAIAKNTPQHASLSVLRSPDIPSILVETGFLSNTTEEQRLATSSYRKQIARAIYYGLVNYRNKNSQNLSTPQTVKIKSTSEQREKSQESEKSAEKKKAEKVKREKQGVQAVKNQEKNAKANEEREKKAENKPQASSKNSVHLVGQDETVYSIARMYNTTPEKISQLNNLKAYKIHTGQKLKVR